MKLVNELCNFVVTNGEKFEKTLGTSKAALIYYLCTVISQFFISLFIKITKFSGKFYIVGFWRGFFGVVFTQIIFFSTGQSFNNGKESKIIFIRSILIIQQQLFFYFLTKEIPLSQLWILTNTFPIWAYFIKFYFYGLKVKKKEIIGIIISFIGVILVINPAIFLDIFEIEYNKNSKFFHINSEDNKYIYAKGFRKIVLCLFYFISNAGIAYGFILTHMINKPGLMQNSHFFIYFELFSLPFRFFYADNISYNINEYFQIFIVLGIILYFSQLFGVRALTIEKNTGKLTLLNYVQVILSFLIEIFSLKEYPSYLNLLGMIFILIGLYLVNK